MNSTQFTYAAARVRALEPKLLDTGDVERMLGAKNAQEAYKILNDLEYATHIGDIEQVENFQEVITAGLHDSKEVLDRICPDPQILDIIFLRYDFHNIKTILKGQMSEKSEEEIRKQLLPLGRVPMETMMQFFLDKENTSLPLPVDYAASIKGWIEMAKETAAKHGDDPRILDLVLDLAMFSMIADIAALTKNEFVIKFVRQMIDLHNVKTFVRTKMLKQEVFFSENGLTDLMFARGGLLPVYKFTDNLDADLNSLANVFRGTDYHEIAVKGLEAYDKFKSFTYLEKYADEHLMHLAKKSRYTPFGPEALLAYFFAKQNNAQIIRMIMVGKLSGLPEDALRERLHELYV
jgi:V/A-type H+-transporting ATPase subunit C